MRTFIIAVVALVAIVGAPATGQAHQYVNH